LTLDEAIRIVGNQRMGTIKKMVRALSMHPWLNTPEEIKRLEAGQMVLFAMRNRTYYWPPKEDKTDG
jgi:hypothetical protein